MVLGLPTLGESAWRILSNASVVWGKFTISRQLAGNVTGDGLTRGESLPQ